MHEVYICFSKDDGDFAFRAYHVLEQNGIECWVAPRHIYTDENLDDQFGKAIKDAKAVVLIGSRHAFDSEFVSVEMGIALDFNKPIVMLSVDEHVPDKYYKDRMHTIDISGKSENDYYFELVTYVSFVLKRINAWKHAFVSPADFKIFISHSPEDNDYMNAIRRVLEPLGIGCLTAPDDIEVNSNLIRNSINDADAFVLVGSGNAYGCESVGDEITIAVDSNKPCVMLKVDEEIPENLEFYFKNFKWVETSGKSENEYYSMLLDVLIEIFQKNNVSDSDYNFDAFISYSTKDKDFADKVCHELESKDFKCWIAPRNLKADVSYHDQIKSAIALARCLVLIFSENAQNSRFVKNELHTAFEMSKDIIALRSDSSFADDDFSNLLEDAKWFDACGMDFEEVMGGILKEMQHADNDVYSFKYFNDLIHSGAKDIVLDSDIILDEAIELDVDNIVIDGNNHIVTSRGKSRIFNVTANNVTIKNMVFKNGFSEDYGGAIYNKGDLALVNCRFISNTSNEGGGSIYHEKGNLTVVNCEFNYNSTLKFGGALASFSKTLLKGCTFKFNTSKEDGGAVVQVEGELTCRECIFEYNSAEFAGAVGCLSDCLLMDCSFSYNHSKNHTGALVIQDHRSDIINCVFKDNSSDFCSAVAIKDGIVNLNGCRFEDNETKYDSGAIYSENSSINCVDTIFTGNKGGGCKCFYTDFKAVNSQFLNNPGLVIYNESKLNLVDCLFRDNHLDNGRLIFNDENSELSFSGGKIIGNEVNGQLMVNNGKLSMDNLIFQDNTSDILVLNKNELNLSDVKFKGVNAEILNEKCIFARKLSESEILKRIVNGAEGYIERFEIPDEVKYDFGFLNNLIQNAARDRKSVIMLPEDINLENYEQDFFEGGIDIDVDGLTIDGANKTINGKNRTRIFNISAKNVTLKNITFKNGFCENRFDMHTSGGGAIRNIKGSDVVIENCSFISNVSNDDAGAILNNGVITSKNNMFLGNLSKMWGGAILNNGVAHIAYDRYGENSSKMAGAVYNRHEMHLENNIKTDKNTSDITQPILNANFITIEEIPADFDEIIYNTGEVNRDETGNFKSMDYLAEKLNSNKISLENDVLLESGFRLKDITINDECEIDGGGHTIDFNGANFNFIINAKVTFKNIAFKNAYVLNDALFKINGEAIFKNAKFLNNRILSPSHLIEVNEKAHLTLTDSNISNNSSKKHSLITNRCTCEISKCIFTNNDSQAKGGLIYNEPEGNILIDESVFEYNSSNAGGAIHSKGVLKIQNSKLVKNTAEIEGGALICKGKADLENCSFIQNSADYGGAVFVESDSDARMKYCVFKSNRAESDGGALDNYDGEIILNECHFKSNISQRDGGAINNEGNILLVDCNLEENVAERWGGGIYKEGNSTVRVINTKFSQNIPDDVK